MVPNLSEFLEINKENSLDLVFRRIPLLLHPVSDFQQKQWFNMVQLTSKHQDDPDDRGASGGIESFILSTGSSSHCLETLPVLVN